MKHTASFQKKKGLYIENGGTHNNVNLVHQISHEMMSNGFVLSRELFDALSTRSEDELKEVHSQLFAFIKRVVGDGEYDVIYRNFPQSVVEMSQLEFVINALFHYWSNGSWRPEDSEYVNREFKIETVNFKELTLLSKSDYDSIFTDILFSGSSISSFDKEIIEWAIESGQIDLNSGMMSKITFNETKAFVGKLLFDSRVNNSLPTKDATLVLRMYSAYCGGDEGLKENTKFKNPNAHQRRMIMNTLDECYNLEESFKVNREKWLRLLFFLNPLTKVNAKSYPNVYNWAEKLRNSPKLMKTFNAKVEGLINMKDDSVFDLLAKRPGVFTRRLDHMVRVFGYTAFERWISLDLDIEKLIAAYNHFVTRGESKDRSAILASQSSSELVTYDALEALDEKLIKKITDSIMSKLEAFKKNPKKVYIDRSLYYTPFQSNNRASSLSMDGKANGTTEVVPEGKTIRMYCHWDGMYDIDLSALIIYDNNEVDKVGWNGYGHKDGAVVYSGDNTGFSEKNAEYVDIVTDNLDDSIDWIIVDARIYNGRPSFKESGGAVLAGWMERDHPEANKHWLPETVEHAIRIESDARNSFLMAYHPKTRNVVYLDMTMKGEIQSTSDDAIRFRMYLDKFIQLDDGSIEIDWSKLNQGHIINILNDVVDTPEEADIVYDENTTSDSVNAMINA